MFETIKMLLEMAIGRQEFQTQLHNSLIGVFREFLCNEIALQIKEEQSWTVEIEKLCLKVNVVLNKTLRTPNSDRVKKKAVYEVLSEFSPDIYVRLAKNKIIDYYPKKIRLIDKLEMDGNAEFRKFVTKFMPTYKDYVEST